jgi:hypothetical protein
MNSDSLDQVWQNQPVPPAQAYRKLQDRSWELRQRVERLDVFGTAIIAGVGFLLMGLIGVLTGDADWHHSVVMIGGVFWLGWAGWVARQRRQLRRSIGENLLREIDMGLLRLHQNLTYNYWMGWIALPVMCCAFIWSFWFKPHAHVAVDGSDWVWSGIWIVLVTGLVGWGGWAAGRERRREMEKLRASLTELRAALLQLGRSDSDAAN